MTMPTWLLVALCIGAITRLTRMVTDDVILEPFRSWVIKHRPKPADGGHDWLVFLIHCRWCASIYVAGAVTAVAYNYPTSWFVQIPLIALTASMAAGLSGRWE